MAFRRTSFSGAVAFLAAALFFVGPAQAAPETDFRLTGWRVTPKSAVPDSVDPIRVHLRFAAGESTRVEVRFRRPGDKHPAGRLLSPRLAPSRWHHLLWDGRTPAGSLAPAGNYRVFAGPVAGKMRNIGRIRLHSHRFPVDAKHGSRGYIGRFGAPRVGGRTHQGFDVTAACGSPLVAVRAGRILKKAYDPDLYGNFVTLKGEGERRVYKYAHLRGPAPVMRGQKVRAGRRLGSVGLTGNAAGTPCHLHIEIRSRGRLLNPIRLLRAWDW